MSVLDELTQVLAQRKSEDPNTSYVASLHAKGLNKILEKIGEESTEVILAAKDAGSRVGTEQLKGGVQLLGLKQCGCGCQHLIFMFWYNGVLSTALLVEAPQATAKLHGLTVVLQPAFNGLGWNTPDVALQFQRPDRAGPSAPAG